MVRMLKIGLLTLVAGMDNGGAPRKRFAFISEGAAMSTLIFLSALAVRVVTLRR